MYKLNEEHFVVLGGKIRALSLYQKMWCNLNVTRQCFQDRTELCWQRGQRSRFREITVYHFMNQQS